MRFLAIFLSVLILFQPVAWAMPMSTHQMMNEQIDHTTPDDNRHVQSVSATKITLEERCQDIQIQLDSPNRNTQLNEETISAACLLQCLDYCASPAGLISRPVMNTPFQSAGLAYSSTAKEFASYTESPEIPPPL